MCDLKFLTARRRQKHWNIDKPWRGSRIVTCKVLTAPRRVSRVHIARGLLRVTEECKVAGAVIADVPLKLR